MNKKIHITLGALLLLMAITHLDWGDKNLIRNLPDDYPNIISIVKTLWYQSTIMLGLLGLLNIVSAIQGIISRNFILLGITLVGSNLLIYLFLGFSEFTSLISSLPQILLFALVLILLGYALLKSEST